MKRTELARGAVPLQRRTPLARAALRRSRQLSLETAATNKRHETAQERRKGRPRGKDIPQAIRDAVAARSGGDCEAAIKGVCHGRATNIHHRRSRRIQPAHTVPNLLHLCGSGTTGCHGWITREPAAAIGLGWSVSAWGNPAKLPVFIRGRYVLLTEDGGYQTTQRTGWPA